MDKRTLLTMVVMLAFFALVNVLYPVIFPPPPKPQKPAAITESQMASDIPVIDNDLVGDAQGTGDLAAASQAGDNLADGLDTGEASVTLAPAKDIKVETPEYVAVFTETGGRLKSLVLKKYMATRLSKKDPGTNQELVALSPGQSELPLALRLYVNNSDYLDLSGLRMVAGQESLAVDSSAGKLVFTGATAKGLVIERTYTFVPGSYLIGQSVKAKNQSQSRYSGRLGMTLVSNPFGGRQGRYDTVAGYLGGELFTAAAGKAPGKLQGQSLSANSDWLGYMSQYFLTAIVLSGNPSGSQDPANLRAQAEFRPPLGTQVGVSWPLDMGPGSEASYDFSVYYGPKDIGDLEKAGHNLAKSVDLGWFGFLAKPLAWLLRFFYGLVGNYGLAIIIVTFLIKVALAPLTAKSYKSMKQMQKLQPRMQALREKFKDDREAMNKEMMQLYKTYKVNPLGGCLPMLLQIPFFIAFYRVLDYALELRGAPFFLWIQDLSAPDRLFDLGVKIPFLDPPTGIPVMTILMGASMLWQQKMTPAMGDPMQAKIMMLMPLVFSVILLNMPAGLVLYWLVNNILSIVQQKFINRPEPPAISAAAASAGDKQAKTGK